MAASHRQTSFEELAAMHPLDRDFLAFWVREREYDQMQQLGRLMGVFFNAGEVRKWKGEGGKPDGSGFEDEDNILVPLAFMLRPEARESIQKMVGQDGLALPQGYRRKEGEVVVDLGKVSKEEFLEFVEKNRVGSLRG